MEEKRSEKEERIWMEIYKTCIATDGYPFERCAECADEGLREWKKRYRKSK